MSAFARVPLLTTLAYSMAQDETQASLLEAIQPLPSTSDSTLATPFAALELAESARQRRKPERARPQIGGNSITWEWLRSLQRRECIYRFRPV